MVYVSTKDYYVTLNLAPDLKKNIVYVSSYSTLNKGHLRILSNSMLHIDERIILP